jgi:hypothetical protein
MKKLSALMALLLFCTFSMAQHILPTDKKTLQSKEDSMKTFAYKIIEGINPSDRFFADSSFTKILMRALKTRNSFYYSFDSLPTISMQYAPDSSFKIITWQLMLNENLVRHHGVIQMRTADGSLKRFPLIDKTVITNNILDTISNNLGWMGAIYYKIIQKKYLGKNYYTLLGFDANNIRSDRKLIEVLTFNNDEPIFGGPYFSRVENVLSPKTTTHSRYIMEYKKDAGPRLSYDPDQDMIILEHLISESGETNKKWTYIGDGDYEGFKWLNGQWVHVDKVYNLVTPTDKLPMPKPLRDNEGNINEKMLKGNEELPVNDPKPVKKKDQY